MTTKFIGVSFEPWEVISEKFDDYIEALNWYNRQDNGRPKYICAVIQTNQINQSKTESGSIDEYMTMTLGEFNDRFGFHEDNWVTIGFSPWCMNEGTNPGTIVKLDWNKANQLGIYKQEFDARKVKGN